MEGMAKHRTPQHTTARATQFQPSSSGGSGKARNDLQLDSLTLAAPWVDCVDIEHLGEEIFEYGLGHAFRLASTAKTISSHHAKPGPLRCNRSRRRR
jgi:hypothetical protein